MTQNEYEFLMDTWSGKDGRAYAAVSDDCFEMGWIDQYGLLTPKGEKALTDYRCREGITGMSYE